MKELIIVRHAKSSWDDTALADHERPLNERGRRDAPRVAEWLRARDCKPDIVLSSTALRARTTAEIFCDTMGLDRGEVLLESEAYLANVPDWLRLVQAFDEEAGCAMIFGHNPGLWELANFLVPDAPISHMATCSVVRVGYDGDFWASLDREQGHLIEHLWPKMNQA